jgi:hypothetical protein
MAGGQGRGAGQPQGASSKMNANVNRAGMGVCANWNEGTCQRVYQYAAEWEGTAVVRGGDISGATDLVPFEAIAQTRGEHGYSHPKGCE